MPPSWGEYRKVVSRNGFELKRSAKHETWVQLDDEGRVLRHTTISHGNAPIRDRGFFHRLLKQCDKTEEHFYEVLKKGNRSN